MYSITWQRHWPSNSKKPEFPNLCTCIWNKYLICSFYGGYNKLKFLVLEVLRVSNGCASYTNYANYPPFPLFLFATPNNIYNTDICSINNTALHWQNRTLHKHFPSYNIKILFHCLSFCNLYKSKAWSSRNFTLIISL